MTTRSTVSRDLVLLRSSVVVISGCTGSATTVPRAKFIGGQHGPTHAFRADQVVPVVQTRRLASVTHCRRDVQRLLLSGTTAKMSRRLMIILLIQPMLFGGQAHNAQVGNSLSGYVHNTDGGTLVSLLYRQSSAFVPHCSEIQSDGIYESMIEMRCFQTAGCFLEPIYCFLSCKCCLGECMILNMWGCD